MRFLWMMLLVCFVGEKGELSYLILYYLFYIYIFIFMGFLFCLYIYRCAFLYTCTAQSPHTQVSCNEPNNLHYIIIIIIIIVGSQLAWLCEAAAQQSMYDTFVVLMSPMTCVCVCVCVQSIVRRMRSISSSTILFCWVLHIFFLLVLHNLNIYNYLYFA